MLLKKFKCSICGTLNYVKEYGLHYCEKCKCHNKVSKINDLNIKPYLRKQALKAEQEKY